MQLFYFSLSGVVGGRWKVEKRIGRIPGTRLVNGLIWLCESEDMCLAYVLMCWCECECVGLVDSVLLLLYQSSTKVKFSVGFGGCL